MGALDNVIFGKKKFSNIKRDLRQPKEKRKQISG